MEAESRARLGELCGCARGRFSVGHVAHGLGTYEDEAATRGLWQDWVDGYEELDLDVEALDVGNGVVLAAVRQDARPVGSTGRVRAQQALVYAWANGMVARVTIYPDIDEARAAAEHLADERG